MRFLDAQGFAWQAVEVVPAGAALAGTLYFFSGGSTRRLERYPLDWRACAWDELDRLCRGATVLSADLVRQ